MDPGWVNRWAKSRHGSHAGRGFHYQEAVATHLAIRAWVGELPARAIIPEGLEDVSLETADGWTHVQIKSRRSHEGPFSLGDVAAFLVKAWNNLPARQAGEGDSALVLVLERPIRGAPESGWDRTIVDVPDLAAALRTLLADLADPEREALLGRSRIATLPLAADRDVERLSAGLGLPPLACIPHYWVLNARLAELADENGVRTAEHPAMLHPGDMQRLFDELTAIVDLDALDAAIRDGTCEVVDFLSPLRDAHFFEGVDVAPGHVVAGLPVERPELVDGIVAGLLKRRSALVIGPSGAGKSAAVWLSAFATRHLVRWYRVKKLRDEDVEPLLRLAAAARPSDDRPVGFAVDSLGRDDYAGWDRLLEEAAQRAGILLLGATREEDLALLGAAHRSHQVRPALTEDLAERVYAELRGRGVTAWQDWREPFEQSRGLLLEYGHLLTAGERLAETIEGQIARRLREGRDLELDVLRLVATADVWGGTLGASALQGLLGVSAGDVQRALARLLDEHLVRERSPGVLSGLHELRSRHIVAAAHRLPPPSLPETVAQVVATLDPADLQGFVAGVLAEDVVGDGALFDGVADRLRADPDPRALAAALQALRLVGFLRLAQGWIGIMEEESVPLSKAVTAANLALTGAGEAMGNLLLPSIRAALDRMIPALADDLRGALLARLPDEVLSAIIERIDDLAVAIRLLASLAGIAPGVRVIDALRACRDLTVAAPLDGLARLLAAARDVDVGLAESLAVDAGGTVALLGRIEREKPWVRELRVAVDEQGRATVEGVWRYVAPSVQADPHGTVVETCALLLACVPEAEVAACRAVDAVGATVGSGDWQLANKRIARRNLPGSPAIAWTRARLRAVASLLGAKNLTARLTSERALIASVARLLAIAADDRCLGRTLSASLEVQRRAVVAEAEALPPPPGDAEIGQSPLDPGSLSIEDPLVTLAGGIAGNMIPRLFRRAERRPALMAYILDTLLPAAERLRDAAHWRLLSDPPLATLGAICRDLRDLHAVIAEWHFGGADVEKTLRRGARALRPQRSLQACAGLARGRADERLKQTIAGFRRRLERQSYAVQVFRREQRERSALTWPPGELAVLVEVDNLAVWRVAHTVVLEACGADFGNLRPIVVAPVRVGRAVAVLGGRAIGTKFFPEPARVAEWRDDLPVPFLEGRASMALGDACAALAEIAGIAAGARGGEVPDDEGAALTGALGRWREANAQLGVLVAEDTGTVLADVLDVLDVLAEAVEDQIGAVGRGEDADLAVVGAVIAALNLSENVLVPAEIMIGMHLAAAEWDIAPEGALDRLVDAVVPSP